MRLEDRWKEQQRVVVKEREGYTKDAYIKDDEPLHKVLAAGAIAMAGFGLYRAGALRKGISEMIEYANNYKAITPSVISEYSKWSKNIAKIEAPEKSLLRQGGFKDFVKKMAKEGYDKENFNATMTDIKNLKTLTSDRVERTVKQHNSGKLRNVDKGELNSRLLEMRRASSKIKSVGASAKADEIMRADLLKKMTVSDKSQQKALKRTGYRVATIDDIFEIGKDKKNRTTIHSKDGIDIGPNVVNSVKDFLENTHIEGDGGKSLNLIQSNKYKKIKLDDNILINEKGKIADLRDANETRNQFIRAASTEFKIPFVGINPLKLFGGDKVGQKKGMFDVISNKSVQNGITGKQGSQKLGDMVDFSDTYTLFSGDTLYKYNYDKQDFDVLLRDRELLAVNKMGAKDTLSKDANNFRKMANIKTKTYTPYTKEDGAFKQIKSSISKGLDIGRQEGEVYGGFTGLFDAINPNKFVEKASDKAIEAAKLNKKVESINPAMAFGTLDRIDDELDEVNDYVNLVIKKRHTLKDVISPSAQVSIADYFSQYLKGRKDLREVNTGSLGLYNLFERMNQALNGFGLALSPDSTGDVISTATSLVTKRFLPVYLGYQGLEYLNYLGETEDGDTMQKEVARGVASADLAVRELGDVMGVSKLAKKIKDLTPGSEHLEELPFIKNINLDNTAEEQAEWYREGYDPIRKGRYWDLGNTAFTGGKVTHFEANWFRKTIADSDFTKEKYGSREEYFKNHWLPTPTNPLAPVRHFVTDRYHYDVKHYDDRPYLMTSAEFEHVPIIGPALSSTLGRIVKPQRKMHREYWEPGTGDAGVKFNQGNGAAIVSSPEMDFLGEAYATSQAKPNKRIYTTGSGATSIVDIGEYDENYINEQLESRGLASIPNVRTRVRSDIDNSNIGNVSVDFGEESDETQVPVGDSSYAVPVSPTGNIVSGGGNLGTRIMTDDVGSEKISAINPNSLTASFADQFRNSANVLGIYGYGTTAFVTGDIGEDKKVIDTSGYAMSYNKNFHDANLGGFGGDFSEIFRRLVQKRRNDVEYINPVRNNMADWLPGEEYFTDFKTGDPFGKLQSGELRLPGEAYQRLWNKNIYDMELGISDLSKSSEELYDKILSRNAPEFKSEDEVKIQNEHNSIKNRIIKKWGEEGYATGINPSFKNDEHKINGKFDAIIDEGSKGSLANIKVVDSKTFNDIKENGILNKDYQEMNMGLGLSDYNKGYVKYVNADDNSMVVGPDGGEYQRKSYEKESLDFKVKFDKDSFDNVISKVKSARDNVLQDIDNKVVKESELYNHMDRARILADIAPYSDNYRDALASVKANATEEELEEIRKIEKRVTAQKEPLRITPYKFKTANVETIETNISKVDGKSIYVNLDGRERAINFAGITGLVDPTNANDVESEVAIKQHLQEGNAITLKVDNDKVVRDRTKGIKAVVIDKKGTNINKALIEKKIVEEKTEDNSAVSVHARYSDFERFLGSTWEKFAHMDNIFNNKFLKVRSAKEEYERNEVYGKNFQSWDNPIKDYLKPTLDTNINRAGGMLWGAMIGAFFGSSKPSRMVGAAVGASVVGAGKLFKGIYEATTGEKWVPKRRREERELNEYVDALKYVKNTRLYNHYAEQSLEQEGFDVKAYVANKESEASDRKSEIKTLTSEKEEIKELEEAHEIKMQKKQKRREAISEFTGLDLTLDEEEFKSPYREKLQEINSEINDIKTYREVEGIPELAMKALEYKDKADKTMFGYKQGDPLQNIISALPKKDRDAMRYLIKAPEEEREGILDIVPSYLKRALQSSWGMEVDAKPSLTSYFSEHQLPSSDWEGWDPNVDLDSVKVKMINREGQDYSEHNIWKDDIDKANSMGPIALPSIDFKSNASNIQTAILDVLSGVGLKDVDVQMSYQQQGMSINLDIERDDRASYMDRLKNSLR